MIDVCTLLPLCTLCTPLAVSKYVRSQLVPASQPTVGATVGAQMYALCIITCNTKVVLLSPPLLRNKITRRPVTDMTSHIAYFFYPLGVN